MGPHHHRAPVNDAIALCRFGLDALLTIGAAWLLVRTILPGGGVLERLLGWGLAFLLIVVASGEMLSWGGALGANGFLLAHAAVFFALALGRRKSLADDKGALHGLGREVRAQLLAKDAAAFLGVALLLIPAGLVILAALGKPVVYDALTYRLSRIGLWLQDGRIAHFATDDARLNYMPVAPDLVMAWLLGAQGEGFQWAALAQTLSGGLLLGATVGLARCTGLSRAASLGAAALLFGMANVVPQFTSPGTDLFTAGVFAAAFYLWLAAHRRGEASLLAGAGVALAVGSKGTLLYLAPGALLWVLCCGWRQRAPWRATILGGVLAALLLVVPGFSRNWQSYHSLLGPAESVRQQHGGEFSLSDHLWKLRLNLATTLAQLFEPNAQPPGWRAGALRMAESLATRLPAVDKFSFDELDRRANVQKVLRLPEPDADVASCGVLSVALLAAGFLGALLNRRRVGAGTVLVWSSGVVLFVLTLYALLQWHPYSFRFWLLVAPWMTVVAAWGLESLPGLARKFCWAFVAFCTVTIFWNSTLHTYQAGWPAVAHPERGLSFTVFSQVRQWTRSLDPATAPLHVALPVNQPLAAFVRLGDGRRVELQRLSALPATAEVAVQNLDGWLIVPVRQFVGREGRVEKRSWLFFGDEASPFSLVAYRRLRP
jgi:hypothetical protein